LEAVPGQSIIHFSLSLIFQAVPGFITRAPENPNGRIAVGTDAIRKFYTDLLATGRTFELGELLRPAMLRENLALTRLPTGIVTR
jgi:hypothetical protein